ncbi:MAG: hypothetical protein ABIT09_04865 [Croceibacterium sp.]
MKALPIALLTAATAACTVAPTATASDAGVRASAVHVIGPAISCLTPSRITDSRVRDDYTIDFRLSGGRSYRNTLPQRCSGLGFEERFGYTLHGSQLCRGEIIHVLYSGGGPGAACALGEFVPIEGAR